MQRRAFLAVSSLAAIGACFKASGPIELPHFTAEALLARIAENAKSGKLTALHFWATWCGPCIDEFPLIEQEWRGWIRAEKNIDFLAVSVDDPPLSVVKKEGIEAAVKARDESVRKFVREHGASFPQSVADAEDADDFSSRIDPAWRGVLPTTLLFGLDAQLAYRNIGTLRVSKFGDTVRDLLAGKQ